jgi:hypothetical protein
MMAVLDCYLSQALSSIPFTAFIPVYHFAHPVPKRRIMPTRKIEKLCSLSSPCICFYGVWIGFGHRLFCVDAYVLICEHEQNLMLDCPLLRIANRTA